MIIGLQIVVQEYADFYHGELRYGRSSTTE